MAGTSLLALIDDIATLLDDVSIMTKVAAKKTAGVLGDDLALNAEQVTGVVADRELPVVWAVAKGSMINKVILVPAALLISAVASFLITPLLMLGGGFLCFEGFEKVFHKLFDKDDTHDDEIIEAALDPSVDMVAFEKEKIKGAVRTDFILSAEIIVISLGTVSTQPFATQVGVLVAISLLITVGVYGLVAGIVKLDDLGFALSRKGGGAAAIGNLILKTAPWLMRGLGVFGTLAMFLVGGGIIVHGVPGLEPAIHELAHAAGSLSGVVTSVLGGLVGVVVGGLVVGVVTGAKKALGKA